MLDQEEPIASFSHDPCKRIVTQMRCSARQMWNARQNDQCQGVESVNTADQR
jgi:hypothetical protein